VRIQTITHVRPVVRRGTDVVLAWIFRLTLDEDGQTAFDDIVVELRAEEPRPIAAWTRSALDPLLVAAAAWHPPHPSPDGYRCPGCASRALHQKLDARLATEERGGFDIGSLKP